MKNENIKKEILKGMGFGNLNILKLPSTEMSISVEDFENIIDKVVELARSI